MNFIYEIISKTGINESHRQIVAQMLEEQQKIEPPYENKADKCKLICIVSKYDIPIAIGAIKNKTERAFTPEKANVIDLSEKFEWELGYIFVKKEFEGQGIASNIARLLLSQYGNDNLIASPEINANPGMVKILNRFGFRLYGNPWKSNIHPNYLGLFLRFK